MQFGWTVFTDCVWLALQSYLLLSLTSSTMEINCKSPLLETVIFLQERA